MDKLSLKNLQFTACHGCYEQEKTQAQPFVVSLDMFFSIKEAAAADDLNLTVNYAALYGRLKQLVEQNSFNLIETLAEKIADLALNENLVNKVQVEIQKPQAGYEDDIFTSAVLIMREK